MTARTSSDALDEAKAYELIQDLHACACDALDRLCKDAPTPGDLVDVATILKGARDAAADWIQEYEAEEESP